MAAVPQAATRPVDAYLRHAASLSAYRTRGADYGLYERLKGDLVRHCPDLSPAEYDRAIRCLSRLAGV